MDEKQTNSNIKPASVKAPVSASSVLDYRVLLKDPLSEMTRKERRNLLAISMIAIAMVKAGLLPTEITTLGIRIDTVNQGYLINVLIILIFYFMIMLGSYGFSDFIAWRLAFWEAVQARLREKQRQESPSVIGSLSLIPDPQELLEAGNRGRVWLKSILPASLLRVFVDFGIPLIAGFLAIIILIASK